MSINLYFCSNASFYRFYQYYFVQILLLHTLYLIKYPGQGLHDQINIHDRSGLEVLGDGMDLLLHKLCEKKQGKLFIR